MYLQNHQIGYNLFKHTFNQYGESKQIELQSVKG